MSLLGRGHRLDAQDLARLVADQFTHAGEVADSIAESLLRVSLGKRAEFIEELRGLRSGLRGGRGGGIGLDRPRRRIGLVVLVLRLHAEEGDEAVPAKIGHLRSHPLGVRVHRNRDRRLNRLSRGDMGEYCPQLHRLRVNLTRLGIASRRVRGQGLGDHQIILAQSRSHGLQNDL